MSRKTWGKTKKFSKSSECHDFAGSNLNYT